MNIRLDFTVPWFYVSFSFPGSSWKPHCEVIDWNHVLTEFSKMFLFKFWVDIAIFAGKNKFKGW